MELIVAEYDLGCRLGQTPNAKEYLHRFPNYCTPLAERLRDANATAADTAPRPSALPERLGRYRLEREIARGGMGRVVARIFDEEFQRPLAMKVLLSHSPAEPDLTARFLREARLTGQLQHPGVPPVQEMGQLPDGQPYFIMKLIEEKVSRLVTAADLLQPEPTVLVECLRADLPNPGLRTSARDHSPRSQAGQHHGGSLWRSPGDGLGPGTRCADPGGRRYQPGPPRQCSHRRGPQRRRVAATSNRAASRSGQYSQGQTAAGQVLGTPAYMAPEQARGDIDGLDARCDVFGLGALLCEILTGQPPFVAGSVGANLQLAQQGDLTAAFARLNSCGADTELVQLAQKCLARTPEERLPEAGAVADAVARYQADLQQRLQQAEIEQAAAQAKAAGIRNAPGGRKTPCRRDARAVTERQRRRVQLPWPW